jgi:hypothetical protein
MSDYALNESAVAEQSQMHEVDLVALPSATSSSEKLLRRIASLLFILVAGLLTVFGYYASSLRITVVLAHFSPSWLTPWSSYWRNSICRAVWPPQRCCSQA